MDLHQLKTFVTVAREGSITRASELLFRSQPAVSAHIKSMEETLDLVLFQRTPRGMSVTPDGQRLLIEAKQLLEKHQSFLESASRLRGNLAGKLRIGTGRNSGIAAVSNLLLALSRQFPEVEVELQHRSSAQVLEGIRNGSLDAGFYTETETDEAEMFSVEISNFRVYLAAASDFEAPAGPVDWKALEKLPWIYPTCNSCCGRLVQDLMKAHDISPDRIINVDDETVTRTLIASGVGVGLVHIDTNTKDQKDISLLCQVRKSARVLFGHLTCRSEDPIISAVRTILEPDDSSVLLFDEGRPRSSVQVAS